MKRSFPHRFSLFRPLIEGNLSLGNGTNIAIIRSHNVFPELLKGEFVV